MEVRPDFDAREVARTVAKAVSNLHNRGLSSSIDSISDDTPLICNTEEAMESKNTASDQQILYKDENKQPRGIFSMGDRIPARYVLTFMGFLGFANVYALRVNLSVALVAMVNRTAITHNESTSDSCPVTNSTKDYLPDGNFAWFPDTQSTILGAFFYGYIITQIPGGRMAEIFGGKWLFGIGVLFTAIFTLLTPIASHWGVGYLIALRVLEGLGEGVTFPAMHAMLGRWLPKYERSLLSTIIYSGAQIGTVVSMPISGLLCASTFLGGWPSVFYVFGILGCLWFIFWTLLIHEYPEKHPRISRMELLLLQNETETESSREKPVIPWKTILTSVPVWALIFTHFGQNWGFYTLLTELPTYLSVMLHFNIKNNGFISALPYLLQAICSWIISYFADIVRRKKIVSINTIRKICNSIGFFGPAVCFLGVAFAKCNDALAVAFLTLAMGLNGAVYSGFMVTHVDMSPTFAGTLMGLTNGFANLAGFLAPAVVGALTKNNETLFQWQIVFYIGVGAYVVAGILYVVCCSARLQPWDPSQIKSSIINKENASEKDTLKDS